MSNAYYERRRQRVWRKIKNRGFDAVLIRGANTRRACFVLEDAYSSREIMGVVQQGDRRFMLAALDPDGDVLLPPDEQLDSLIVTDPDEESITTELLLASPPGRLAPGGVVVYYELHCRMK